METTVAQSMRAKRRPLSRPCALLFILIGAAPFAHSECAAYSCTAVSISQLVITATGGYYVATSGNEQLASCTPNSGIFLYMPASTAQVPVPNFKEIYATLLAAQLANKIVTIDLNPSIASPCTISYVTINEQ
jgi:hypothetical protein